MKSINDLLDDLASSISYINDCNDGTNTKFTIEIMKAQQLVGQIRWRLKND